MGKVFDHPAARLMAEVSAENGIVETQEARVLQDNIFKAVTNILTAMASSDLAKLECWRHTSVDRLGRLPSTRVCPWAKIPTDRSCSSATALSRLSENSWSPMMRGGSHERLDSH
jgi:hypothetical protein